MGTTPVFNIPYPSPLDKARDIPQKIEDFALGVEVALIAAGTPPVVTGASVVAASAAARDLFWGIPANATERLALQARGATTIRTDKGWTEVYLAAQADGGVNPGGAAIAGWVRSSIGTWTPYTPTFTALTASAVDFQWRREGQLIRVSVKFTCTTQAAGNPGFTLPVAAETAFGQYGVFNGVLSRADSVGNSPALLQVNRVGNTTTDVRLYGWGVVPLVAGAIPNGQLVQGEFTYRPAS